ncbi:Ger(x)C family spore germination protein [Chungangia koreensis]|uniref:Ger(X)C family spore germination protein n=1 Tax=Chungangia koreensis TaxID=752657 RepID=A0ABV8X790_9LACT
MKKKWLPILFVVFLLGGCWDEQLFKNISIVQMVGYEGDPGEITAYFSYPKISKDNIEYLVIKGEGISLHAARIQANKKTNQLLDLSVLEVALMSDETVTHNIYDYLDPFYRIPKNRLNARLVIVEGSMDDYINEQLNLTAELPDFYSDLIESSVLTSESIDVTLQKACTILFDPGIDLTLPYLQIDKESSNPKLGGAALFSDMVYTGEYLTTKESVLLNIMRDQIGKQARLTYQWNHKGKEYPLIIDVEKAKKKWRIDGENLKLHATYNLNISINELAVQSIAKKETINELEKFLNEKIEGDMKGIFQKIQDAESDALGIGRQVRAFHPNIWKEGKWHDTYKKIDFDVKVKSTIYSTGILQ